MKSLQCLFVVQGEGRGHLTQALALRNYLARAGHHVCGAIVSPGDDNIPAYFPDTIGAPVRFVESTHFVVDKDTRSIHWMRTLTHNNKRWRHFHESCAVIEEEVQIHRPDVIINFYEPLVGLYATRYKSTVPVVAIAHQYMFLHPQYAFYPGFKMQRRAATLFTRITATRAARLLALSAYDAPALPSEKLRVMPPLLRDELFKQPLGVQESFFLMYLFHHSCSSEVVAWHERNPAVPLHCFWNNPDAEETRVVDSTLTFHRLHGERFLEMMARSRGVITTSGFESMIEAMYLGKPLLLTPMHRHFEQYCNALDGTSVGAAVQSEEFDIDRLIRFLPEYRYNPTTLRNWVATAEGVYVKEIEEVVEATRPVMVSAVV